MRAHLLLHLGRPPLAAAIMLATTVLQRQDFVAFTAVFFVIQVGAITNTPGLEE